MTNETDPTTDERPDEAAQPEDATPAQAADAAGPDATPEGTASSGEVDGAPNGAPADDAAGAPEDEEPDWDKLAADDGRSPGELLEALATAEHDRDDYLDALQRSRAEFDNFRRRSAREAAGARQAGVGDLAKQLLAVIDDIDRTVTVAQDSSDEGLAAGIAAVQRKLVDVLVAAGVQRIDEADVPFDANRHEAVQQVPADEPVDEPEVAQVLRPGYLQGDRVLRAAMVTVRQ